MKEKYPPGTVSRGHGPQPDQLRGVRRDRGRHRRPAARVRHVLDPEGRPSLRDAQEGPEDPVRGARRGPGKKRVALGLKQLNEDPWMRRSPSSTCPAQIVKGKVTKVTNFGVFVELEPSLEGLLHVSELADHKVENPEGRRQARRGASRSRSCAWTPRAEDRPEPQIVHSRGRRGRRRTHCGRRGGCRHSARRTQRRNGNRLRPALQHGIESTG